MASWPIRAPPRCFNSRYGALVMLSMPPAMITLALPAANASCAMIIACMPLPHILLMVTASTCNGNPAPNAACRAGAWPNPPGNTHPITI